MPLPWSRRDFLGTIGAVALSGVRSAPVTASRRRPLGIQLYTVRDALERDFEGTLRQLADIGYKEVEFAGLLGHLPKDVRAALNHLGLRAPAGHYDLAAIQDGLPQTIAEAQALGFEYVIVPWIPEEFRTQEGFPRLAQLFNRAGATLRGAGLGLGYHNNAGYDFTTLPDGRSGYDVLLEETDPKLVLLELDLFWIRQGGGDALTYLRRYPDRYRLVHIKDMAPDGTMVDIGKGVMNWSELLSAARKAGVRHFIVEHDRAIDPLAFAKTGFEYLRGLRF